MLGFVNICAMTSRGFLVAATDVECDYRGEDGGRGEAKGKGDEEEKLVAVYGPCRLVGVLVFLVSCISIGPRIKQAFFDLRGGAAADRWHVAALPWTEKIIARVTLI